MARPVTSRPDPAGRGDIPLVSGLATLREAPTDTGNPPDSRAATCVLRLRSSSSFDAIISS